MSPLPQPASLRIAPRVVADPFVDGARLLDVGARALHDAVGHLLHDARRGHVLRGRGIARDHGRVLGGHVSGLAKDRPRYRAWRSAVCARAPARHPRATRPRRCACPSTSRWRCRRCRPRPRIRCRASSGSACPRRAAWATRRGSRRRASRPRHESSPRRSSSSRWAESRRKPRKWPREARAPAGGEARNAKEITTIHGAAPVESWIGFRRKRSSYQALVGGDPIKLRRWPLQTSRCPSRSDFRSTTFIPVRASRGWMGRLLRALSAADPALRERFDAAHADPAGSPPRTKRELLIAVAPHLDRFIAKLFAIEEEWQDLVDEPPSPGTALPREAQVRAAPRDAEDQGRRRGARSTDWRSKSRSARGCSAAAFDELRFRRARPRLDRRRGRITLASSRIAERFAAWAAHTDEGRWRLPRRRALQASAARRSDAPGAPADGHVAGLLRSHPAPHPPPRGLRAHRSRTRARRRAGRGELLHLVPRAGQGLVLEGPARQAGEDGRAEFKKSSSTYRSRAARSKSASRNSTS